MRKVPVFVMIFILGFLLAACTQNSFSNSESEPQNLPEYSVNLGFDAIKPIYEPRFVSSEEAAHLLFDDELIMGVAWGEKPKLIL